MSRSRVRGGVAGLATLAVFGVVLALLGPGRQSPTELRAEQKPAKKRPQEKPIAMPANLVGLEILLGLKDKEPSGWGGSVQVSAGRLASLAVIRGGPNGKADGNRYTARTTRPGGMMQPALAHPTLRADLEAPLSATVTVTTRQGKFSFVLSDLSAGKPKTFLDGAASVERNDGALRLTGRDTEDDYPALTRGPDGTTWLAYVEYQPGKPLITERVLAGGFEELEPSGHGDQIRLMRFDGKVWQPGLDVTDPGLDVWRPTLTVDGKGDVYVAWSQQIDGDWEIFSRRYTPPADKDTSGKWSDIVRVTNAPGADFHVVAATDAAGVVWLAWQAWRGDNFEILLAPLADGPPARQPKVLSTSKANDWSPAIAADSKGNVYVAWDSY